MINENLGDPLSVTQSESVANGSVLVTSIAVTDGDGSAVPSGRLRFSLEDVTEEGVIEIDSLNGGITVSGILDRESYPSIQARIVVTDQGPHLPTRMSDSIGFILNLQDFNDNSPLADATSYNVTVNEGLSVPTVGESVSILDIPAGDRDVSSANRGFSVLEVTEAEDSAPSSVFIVRASGTGTRFVISLHLISPLDRETQDTYSLTIRLADRGNPTLGSTIDVRVTVTDANDERPFFTSPRIAEVTENSPIGTVVINVTAVDNDIGPNAEFTFTINSQLVASDQGFNLPTLIPVDIFSIDSMTGQVVLSQPVDREGQHSFLLNIQAVDRSGFGMQSLWVMVCEENDNSPLFSQDLFLSDVQENSEIGQVVTQLTANDADDGAFCNSDPPETNNNNIVRYELVDAGDAPFYVDANSGEIIVNGSLDFESRTEYTLEIFAEDLGVPPRNSTTFLNITVTDENDNPPVLSNDTYFNLAVEDAPVSMPVIDFISATDADSPPNDVLRYRILGPNSDDFTIDPITAVISIAQPLDRERVPVYDFTVEVFNPQSNLSDSARVIINVADINDSPPMFSRPSYTTMVSENSPRGTVALTVFATDSDVNQERNIRYVFVQGSDDFALDSISGEITVVGDLCINSNITVELVVTAEDRPGGRLVFSTDVNVSILIFDDNNFDPSFARLEYGAILPDGVRAGYEVLTLTATDNDVCSPPLLYSIQSSPDSENFAIDMRTGVFSVNRDLYRSNSTEYFITV